nr:hypothetical protein Q903MT_gene2565 [Picea sitchensis]
MLLCYYICNYALLSRWSSHLTYLSLLRRKSLFLSLRSSPAGGILYHFRKRVRGEW